jgi:hypothetical protein
VITSFRGISSNAGILPFTSGQRKAQRAAFHSESISFWIQNFERSGAPCMDAEQEHKAEHALTAVARPESEETHRANIPCQTREPKISRQPCSEWKRRARKDQEQPDITDAEVAQPNPNGPWKARGNSVRCPSFSGYEFRQLGKPVHGFEFAGPAFPFETHISSWIGPVDRTVLKHWNCL